MESTGVDWVKLYVWVSKVLGSFAEDVIYIETDLSVKLLEGVMLGATTVWVKEGVIDRLALDDARVTEETAGPFVVNMTLLLFILGVTVTELEVNIELLEFEINVGNELKV